MSLFTYNYRPEWSLLNNAFPGGVYDLFPEGRRGRFDYTKYPLINIWSSDDDILVEAELPGVDPQQVEVTLNEDVLTIAGNRVVDEPKDTEIIHRTERVSGSFSREITLPYRGDADKVSATYRNGILRIVAARAESDKPRRVKIEAA